MLRKSNIEPEQVQDSYMGNDTINQSIIAILIVNIITFSIIEVKYVMDNANNTTATHKVYKYTERSHLLLHVPLIKYFVQ